MLGTGLTSNQGYDTSKIPGILAGLLIPHIICTIFIVARIWSRVYVLRKWFVDDTLMIAAWVFSTAVCAVYSIATLTPNIRDAVVISSDSHSGGGPVVSPDDSSIRTYMMRTYLGLIFYQLCLCLTKLSILAFYLRMFSSRPLERRLAQATAVFVLLYGVPLLFMSIFQCHPSPGHFFDKPMTCFSFVPLLIASASLHAGTDAWLVILVIPCIVRLDLPPRQKAALAVVLSLSVFVVAASMTRLQLSLHANYRPSGAGVQVSNTLAFFVMTILECDLAIICASAPTLRPVLARLWPRLGMGEFQHQHQPRRRRRRQAISDGDNEEDGSVNLTVVSYHGYPWTQPQTPAAGRSKSGSITDMAANSPAADMAMPVPPVPAFMQRTPTTLSLRSFMSSITPRSRGATVAEGNGPKAEDRVVLLRGGGDAEESELGETRRSSVGFEGYHDQYLGYGEEKRRSKTLRNSLVLKSQWGDSQESFVMGMNDPASPSRLSPVSALSGTTYPPISPVTDVLRKPEKDESESK